MQYNRTEDGELIDLPQQNIDTGAGLERILALLQGTQSVFETDVLRRILGVAEAVTGRRYGADEKADVSLRILAEHSRALTFLIGDGVFPGNEGRGYVLRRIIRRAARHARLLGVEEGVTGALVDATVETMGGAYPDLVRQHDFIRTVAAREEARFTLTLRRGLELLDDLLAKGDVSGADAFHLHDTLGLPGRGDRRDRRRAGPGGRPGRLRGEDGGAAAAGPRRARRGRFRHRRRRVAASAVLRDVSNRPASPSSPATRRR